MYCFLLIQNTINSCGKKSNAKEMGKDVSSIEDLCDWKIRQFETLVNDAKQVTTVFVKADRLKTQRLRHLLVSFGLYILCLVCAPFHCNG